MKVLALDFDGVICNSQREVFTVGVRTYLELNPDSRLLVDHPLARRNGLPSELDLDSDRLFAAFADLTPLGNRAEDFGVALTILEDGIEVHDQEGYDAIRAATPQAWLDTYHRRFYAQRRQLRASDPQTWLEFHRPYTHFVTLLRRHSREVPMAVATAKDRTSVTLLLDHLQITDLFAPERILDKDTGVHKTAHLTELARRLDLPAAAITFVDDKVNHLQKVAGLGVRGVLAGWGYNTPREHRIAREGGFEVATAETAEAILFQ
jgi:phosphoglycolate phosphatase-like HAD superfamily hydrolase